MTLAFTITAALVLVAGLFAVIVERTTERDDARELVRRLESEAQRLHLLLTESDLLASNTVAVPLLRSVPTQRAVHEPWPPVARAVEAEVTPIHDAALIDAWIENVVEWGEDV